MNKISLLTIFGIVVVIVLTCFLLKEIYTSSHNGKLIIKVNKERGLVIFWIVALILFSFLLRNYIRQYMYYKENIYINEILVNICWIEVSIINIITALRYSEIREKGICDSFYFYNWSEIQRYSWISSNVIEFEVNTFFKTNRRFNITIKDEYKLKVDEIVRRYIKYQ